MPGSGLSQDRAQEGFLTALAGIRNEIVALDGAALLPELADDLDRYLTACLREAPWRTKGQVPALTAYLWDRAATSGGHPLLLHRLQSAMPPLDRPLSPDVSSLVDLAFLIGGLTNDIVGFPFEQECGDPVNVVTVLAHENDITPAKALDAAVELHAAHKHWFDTESARILADPGADPTLRFFTRAVTGWVAGTSAAMAGYLRTNL
jgi:2-methylisoborneol synthase